MDQDEFKKILRQNLTGHYAILVFAKSPLTAVITRGGNKICLYYDDEIEEWFYAATKNNPFHKFYSIAKTTRVWTLENRKKRYRFSTLENAIKAVPKYISVKEEGKCK